MKTLDELLSECTRHSDLINNYLKDETKKLIWDNGKIRFTAYGIKHPTKGWTLYNASIREFPIFDLLDEELKKLIVTKFNNVFGEENDNR